MKKKSLIMLLIGCLMVGVVGCGGKNSDTEQKSSNQSESAQTEGSSNNNDSSNKEYNKETLDLTTIEGINADQFVTTKKNDEYKYDVYENHIEIVEYLGNEKRVEIPSEIDGLKVCRIVGFCKNEHDEWNVEEVVIPDSVVSLKNEVSSSLFGNGISNLVIPNTVKELSEWSIFETQWYYDLSDEFCIVGDGILIKCNLKDDNLTHLKYPDGIKKVCANNWRCLGFNKRKDAKIAQITFPEGCTEINVAIPFSDAEGYRNIEKINIPNSVKKVSYNTFQGTKWLDDLNDDYVIIGDGVLITYKFSSENEIYEIPDGVKYIATGFGHGDFEVKKVILPQSVEGVCEWFVGNVAEIVFSSDVEFDEFSFGRYNPSDIMYTVPDNIKKIPARLFGNSDYTGRASLCKIKGLVVTDGIEQIGRYAFFSCLELESVELSKSCSYIGDGAFRFCSKLSNITIPEGVRYIGDDVFFGCGNLKSITIPQSATYIGENALKTHKETITDEDGFVRTTYTNIPEIRGVKGSYAETYAKENGINFVEIESN